MSRGRIVGIAAAFGAVILLLGGRRKTTPSPPTPMPPPTPLDDYADYDAPTQCDPTEKPGTRALRELTLEHFGGIDLGTTRVCDDKRDEHEEGRAWDWGIADAQRPANVDGFLQWLLAADAEGRPHANARRLGVMYVIYNRQMWRSYDRPNQPRGRWNAYSGTDPHDTHIHISLSRAGGAGQTSFYRGKPIA